MAASLPRSIIVLGLAWPVSSTLVCAPSGQSLCAGDMGTIGNVAFARQLLDAGQKAFIDSIPGAQAIEATIGAGRLSPGCLQCQGAGVDCALSQSECFEKCSAAACNVDCQKCLIAKCDLQKACGGVAGRAVQLPYTCAGNDFAKLAEDRSLLSVAFTGTCTYRGMFSSAGAPPTGGDEHTTFPPMPPAPMPPAPMPDAVALVNAHLVCAPAGARWCRSDIGKINTLQYAKQFLNAGEQAFIRQISGRQAVQEAVGAGGLSATCLNCQGAAIDCALKQQHCYEHCAAGACNKPCQECLLSKCDLRKACGGAAGESVQMPYSCVGGDMKTLKEDASLLAVRFDGTCSSARRMPVALEGQQADPAETDMNDTATVPAASHASVSFGCISATLLLPALVTCLQA
eukprot:TRINITY_DN253_c0_g1_i1.p1 TRINITY_DN253_c0_g1~~TRINITY_DN253_c0_g1_i1.p1  ORF type:complete len:401 (+),score=87.61 TRINITY_DN253_c0_g1_i1:93-1295(+)